MSFIIFIKILVLVYLSLNLYKLARWNQIWTLLYRNRLSFNDIYVGNALFVKAMV